MPPICAIAANGCSDPGSRLGDALVTPLLAVGQRLVALTLALDLVAKAVLLQPRFTILGRIAPVGIDVAAGVVGIQDLVEVLAVVRAGLVSLDLADELVLFVHVDRELVAEVALAVLLRPGGVDDLTAACDEALLEQLGGDAVEQGFRSAFADAVLEGPHRGAVRNVAGVGQPEKALVAHAVEQLVLHLLVRKVVESLQNQDAHHRLRRVRRAPTLWLTGQGTTLSISAASAAKSMCNSISVSGSPSVSIFLRCCWSANRSVLRRYAVSSEQAAGFRVQGGVILPRVGSAEVFRGALVYKGMR